MIKQIKLKIILLILIIIIISVNMYLNVECIITYNASELTKVQRNSKFYIVVDNLDLIDENRNYVLSIISKINNKKE